MSEQSPKPSPGWYPEGGRQRYWNGEEWTSQYWDVAAGPKRSFWTTGRIVAASVAGVVVLGLGVVGLGIAASAAGFFDPEPPTKAEAIDMCKDFADDDLKYPDEVELSGATASLLHEGDYFVRGQYTVHGGSGPLRCEVELDEEGEGWYLNALTMPEENGGPDQSKKIDVTDD